LFFCPHCRTKPSSLCSKIQAAVVVADSDCIKNVSSQYERVSWFLLKENPNPSLAMNYIERWCKTQRSAQQQREERDLQRWRRRPRRNKRGETKQVRGRRVDGTAAVLVAILASSSLPPSRRHQRQQLLRVATAIIACCCCYIPNSATIKSS
jgi:hypothetical protein